MLSRGPPGTSDLFPSRREGLEGPEIGPGAGMFPRTYPQGKERAGANGGRSLSSSPPKA